MKYADVTLSPDDIEWDDDERVSVWAAANDVHCFELFISQRGLKDALRRFHKAHREIANRCIEAEYTHPDDSEEAKRWIFACRRFKSARNRANVRYRELYGASEAQEYRARLDSRYRRIEKEEA